MFLNAIRGMIELVRLLLVSRLSFGGIESWRLVNRFLMHTHILNVRLVQLLLGTRMQIAAILLINRKLLPQRRRLLILAVRVFLHQTG